MALDKDAVNRQPIGQSYALRSFGIARYFLIDSAHPGGQDRMNGLPYINAADCAAQFPLIPTFEKIGRASLLPVIRKLLDGCSSAVLGFPAGKGLEYITYQIAVLF